MKGARPLTDEEIHLISCSFSGKYAERNRCLFLLGVNIGARVSELTALRIGDVWQHGKAVSVLTLRKETIKGKRESYSIPLNSTAKAVVSELIAWEKKEGESLSPSAYLFASRKGGGRLTRVQAHRILKKAYDKAGITGKVTTHSMRKTVANKVYSATGDLFVVKEVLGHKNLATTQQYLGVGMDRLFDAMEAIESESNFLSKTLHSTRKVKKEIDAEKPRGKIIAFPQSQRKVGN